VWPELQVDVDINYLGPRIKCGNFSAEPSSVFRADESSGYIQNYIIIYFHLVTVSIVYH